MLPPIMYPIYGRVEKPLAGIGRFIEHQEPQLASCGLSCDINAQ
jgi:hypothetical protein